MRIKTENDLHFSKFTKNMIAPCGANCSICMGYLSYTRKTPCAGCLPRNKMCAFLKKRCDLLRDKKVRFCFECAEFPCRELKVIDNRYRTRYNYSFIDNLEAIKRSGVKKFLQDQEKKFRCKNCGGIICVHDRKCYGCEVRA